MTSYVYDGNDRLLTENGQPYTYDANGNELTRPDGARFVYDYENRLVRGDTPAGTLRNTFDVDGVRVRFDTGGAITNYVVDTNVPFSQVLEERDGAGALKAQNVFGLDLIRRSESGQQSYFHFDAQKSVRQLSDAAGVASDGYTYDAFGALVNHTGTSTNPYLFIGERFDAPLGEYDLRARHYDPRIGRFSSVDPALPDWNDPRSLNRYAYSFSDPINRRDPSGEFGLSEVMISVSITGVLAQTAQPGVQAAEVPLLALDYSALASYKDPFGKYTDIVRIQTVATQTTRDVFSAYNVKVVDGKPASHQPGINAARGLRDKTIHVMDNALNEPDCGPDDFGCSGFNGSFGKVFVDSLFTEYEPYTVKKDGHWPGNPHDGMGRMVGNTIAHEAGHTYGLDHSRTGGIMAPGEQRDAYQRIFQQFWDPESQRRLQQKLGLRHP